MNDTPQKPIGSINTAYLGFLFLLWALLTGCMLGGMAVYYFMH